MLKSNLCNYSDAYILLKGTRITTVNARPPAGRTAAQMQTARANNERNNGVLFKTCAPFTYYINEINNKHIDIAEDTDVVMPIIT